MAQVVIVIAGLGLVFDDGFIGLMLFYGIFCAGEAVTYLLCFVYATEAFDPDYIGTSMGAFDSLMDISLFIGPLIGVWFYQVTALIGPVFLIAVVPAIVAFFATAIWLPRSSAGSEEAQKGPASLS